MTVVRPQLQFGVTELDAADGRVTGFREKPRSEHWINGGFSACATARSTTSIATACSSASRCRAWPPPVSCAPTATTGFWECMDTYKDAVALNDLWASGAAPWAGVRAGAQNHVV